MSSSRKKMQNAFSSKFYPDGSTPQRLSMMNGILRNGKLLQRWNSTSHLGAKIGPIIYANRQIQPLLKDEQINFNFRQISISDFYPVENYPAVSFFHSIPPTRGSSTLKLRLKATCNLGKLFTAFFLKIMKNGQTQ